ncbi:unnamed protein product, partial [Nesidiocoris tenuis]
MATAAVVLTEKDAGKGWMLGWKRRRMPKRKTVHPVEARTSKSFARTSDTTDTHAGFITRLLNLPLNRESSVVGHTLLHGDTDEYPHTSLAN